MGNQFQKKLKTLKHKMLSKKISAMAPFVLAMVSMVHGRRIRLTPEKIE